MSEENGEAELVGVHPSEFIQDELEARGWSIEILAVHMAGFEIEKNKLTLDLYSTIGPEETSMRIGDETAEKLSAAFGISAEFFINLEKSWLKANGVDPLPPQDSMDANHKEQTNEL